MNLPVAMLGLMAAVAAPFAPVFAQPAGPNASALSPALQRGRDNALKYCTACHLLPEPESLTKTAWAHHIQPEMAKWLGLERVDYEGMTDGKLLEEAALYPQKPLLSGEEWFSIWDYYRAVAPSQPLPQPSKPAAR